MNSNLRQDTFRQVSIHLQNAVDDLQAAADLLKASEYWSETSEYLGIINMIKKTKSLSKDFYQ